jgi:hypothetical protein
MKLPTVKKELVDGVVDSAKVYAERVDKNVMKLLRVVAIERTPKTLIARIGLETRAAFYAMEIDEPTVRALIKVFDDFRAAHPDGKAPPPPPRWDPANEGSHVDLEED